MCGLGSDSLGKTTCKAPFRVSQGNVNLVGVLEDKKCHWNGNIEITVWNKHRKRSRKQHAIILTLAIWVVGRCLSFFFFACLYFHIFLQHTYTLPTILIGRSICILKLHLGLASHLDAALLQFGPMWGRGEGRGCSAIRKGTRAWDLWCIGHDSCVCAPVCTRPPRTNRK